MSSGENSTRVTSILESQLPAVVGLGGDIRYVRDGANAGLWIHNGTSWSALAGTPFVNVLDYGVTNDDVDSTAAMQAVAASLEGGEQVLFPAGRYRFTDTIMIAQNYVTLIAMGNDDLDVTINFQPTAINKPCFLFSKGGATPAIMVGSGAKNFNFASAGNVQAGKKAIQYEVLEEGTFDNIRVVSWTGNDTAANPCIGIHSYGWQINRHRMIWLKCELPIRCSINPSQAPAPGLDLDHCTFTDLYLQPATTKPCILFDDGIFLSNTHFDGVQAWVGGTHGIQWNDTSSSATGKSYQLTFDGVRRENGTDAAAYCFNITSTSNGLKNLRISNANLNSTQKGILFQSAATACHVILEQVQFSATAAEAINFVPINGQTLSLQGCEFNTSNTVVLTGFKEVFSPGLILTGAPVPSTAYYVFDSAVIRNHLRLAGVSHLAFSGSLADDATLDLQVGSTVGYTVANVFVSMHGATKDEGMVCVASGSTNVFKIAGTANTAVADTDTFLCVYRSSGTIFLKNRLGEAVSYVVSIDAMV